MSTPFAHIHLGMKYIGLEQGVLDTQIMRTRQTRPEAYCLRYKVKEMPYQLKGLIFSAKVRVSVSCRGPLSLVDETEGPQGRNQR